MKPVLCRIFKNPTGECYDERDPIASGLARSVVGDCCNRPMHTFKRRNVPSFRRAGVKMTFKPSTKREVGATHADA